jgi:hypothetical protein
MRRAAALALSACLAIAGCRSVGPSSGPSAGATSAATVQPSAGATPAPARTPVPGYETWSTVNPQAVRISRDGDDLVLELVGSVLWYQADRGVLFSTDITGDFRMTATVRTSSLADPSKPPGGDGTIQLAGLMARTEVPAENYVFIVAGSIGQSTGIETKTTTNSQSIYVQRGRAVEGDADLRLCRVGTVFDLSWREAGTEGEWTRMSTFDRREMPETLQVGVNIYTDGVPGIAARFENLTLTPLADGEGC